jgi:cytochrome c
MLNKPAAAVAIAACALGPAAFAQDVDVAAEMELATQGDAEAGERVFRKCQACHQLGEDAKNRVGPVLNGIIGAEIAAIEDFAYSDAFMEKKAEGFVWTVEHLGAYLSDPRGYIPGNKMTFAGLRKDDEIADVVAYMATFE